MAESLRDQLLKSGLVKEVREERRPSPSPVKGKMGQSAASGKPASSASGQPYAGNRPKQGGRPPQVGKPRPPGGKPGAGGARPPRKEGEIDLAKAYAIRAQTDANERRRLEAEAAEQARLRKEKKRKVEELLKGRALNRPDAEHVRHFPYGGKIRRIYVDAAQLAALNMGQLGVVQQGGRYVLVETSVVDALRDVAPEFIALMVDPNATNESDDGVPDDLMW